VRARPPAEPLARAVVEAVVEQFTTGADPQRAELALITSKPALRAAFLDTVAAVEQPLAAAIADRVDGLDELAADVLAAALAAAARVAAEHWLRSWVAPGDRLLVVPGAALPDLLRTALDRLAPALDAADR
jgi:hypothetical protein